MLYKYELVVLKKDKSILTHSLQEGEPYNESDEEEPCIEEGQITRNVMCVQNNADVVRDSLYVSIFVSFYLISFTVSFVTY